MEERRKYKRIFTRIEYKFGAEKQYLDRELNISASGVAIHVESNLFKALSEKDRLSISFLLEGRILNLDSEVVRLEVSNNKNLVALRFIDVDYETISIIDRYVNDNGGYYVDDPIARNDYLIANFPHMVKGA